MTVQLLGKLPRIFIFLMHMYVKLYPNRKEFVRHINIIKAPTMLLNYRIYYKSGLRLLRTKTFTSKS